jgi:hypothetical protein
VFSCILIKHIFVLDFSSALLCVSGASKYKLWIIWGVWKKSLSSDIWYSLWLKISVVDHWHLFLIGGSLSRDGRLYKKKAMTAIRKLWRGYGPTVSSQPRFLVVSNRSSITCLVVSNRSSITCLVVGIDKVAGNAPGEINFLSSTHTCENREPVGEFSEERKRLLLRSKPPVGIC